MIIALPSKVAKDAASSSGRRGTVRVLVAGVALACLSSFAVAGDRERDRERDQDRDPPRRAQMAPPPPAPVQRELPRAERAPARQSDPRAYDTRAVDAREPRYEPRDDMRRQQQEQNTRHAEASRRSLTAEEKADLRRQINEAGANLYPNAPRR
jgi:hypothetical protein